MNKAVTRRGFVKTEVASGIAFRIGFMGTAAGAATVDDPLSQLAFWIGSDGKARFRTDAVAKVTGAKTFARDYRSRDLPGWPGEQSHAFLIHANRADAVFDSVDLSLLGEALKPHGFRGDRVARNAADSTEEPLHDAAGTQPHAGDRQPGDAEIDLEEIHVEERRGDRHQLELFGHPISLLPKRVASHAGPPLKWRNAMVSSDCGASRGGPGHGTAV